MSELKRRFKPEPFPFPLLKLGLAPDRDYLLPRIQKRTAAMLEAGWLDEVRALMGEGYSGWPALKSVGTMKSCSFSREKSMRTVWRR